MYGGNLIDRWPPYLTQISAPRVTFSSFEMKRSRTGPNRENTVEGVAVHSPFPINLAVATAEVRAGALSWWKSARFRQIINMLKFVEPIFDGRHRRRRVTQHPRALWFGCAIFKNVRVRYVLEQWLRRFRPMYSINGGNGKTFLEEYYKICSAVSHQRELLHRRSERCKFHSINCRHRLILKIDVTRLKGPSDYVKIVTW